jgi:protein SCO1
VQRIYRSRKLITLVAALFALLCGIGVVIRGTATGDSAPGPPPASIGDQMDRPLQLSLVDAGFTDQADDPVRLSDFEGKVVVLVPFLTSCQEECPVTTGALLSIERALTADHFERKVAIVEVTVDPGRDSPERMDAYAKLTGVSWTLLTAPASTIAALWRFYGIYYQDVPEGSPPGIDWQTHQPYTYDVDHSDGFIVLDPHLDERFVAAGMVRDADLTPALRHLLDSQGRDDLTHPGGGSWTIDQALQAIGWVLGRSVPVSGRS